MKQKNGSNFLRLRCRKFLFPQQSIYFRRKNWRKQPDGGVAVSKIGSGFQFGQRRHKFTRHIVGWHFSKYAFAVIRRDFRDGEFLGVRQSFDPLKICSFIAVGNHNDFMCPDAGDDLLRAGSWLAFGTLKARPSKRKTANFSMTAEFDPKTFIGTVVSIAPKTNPIKLTGQIDAPATNLIG